MDHVSSTTTRCISEMGVDEVGFMNQYWEMDSLDQFILQPNDQQQMTTTSLQYCINNNPPLMNNTMSNSLISNYCSSMKTKMSRTGSWSSMQAPPDASPTSILSFGGGRSDSPVNYDEFLVEDVKPNDLKFLVPSSGSKRSHEIMVDQGVIKKTVTGARPPSYQDHIIAERKRREKLSQRFIALSAIIPNLKKTDKVSILGDAVKYVKQLQEKMKTLEEQVAAKKMESAILGQTNANNGDDDHNSIQTSPKIEATQTEKTVLIKIQCENQKGMMGKALFEIENFNLSIINTSSMSFPSSTLDVTVLATIEEGFAMTMEEVVKKLNLALKETKMGFD